MGFFNINLDDLKSGYGAVSDGYDFNKVYDDSYIDISEELKPIKPLLSIGNRIYKEKVIDTYVCTEGEMSAIVAPSKTMKSFFASALISGFIGGKEIENRFQCLKSHRVNKCTVLHFDTEQGEHYAQKTFRRVGTLSDVDNVNYVTFAMRSLSADHRVKLIDDILKKQKELFNNEVKLIVIDGIADLVDNTNDIVMSKVVSDYVMRWTNDYNLHIICVIHKNFGENSKPVGHLGSFVTKKAETVFLLQREKDGNEINVTCDYSRGYSFDPFSFYVDEHSLPYQTDAIEINDVAPSFLTKTNNIPF